MAWCALPCMRPSFFYDADVPNDARKAINEWRSKSTYLESAPPSYYLQSLCDPFEMKLNAMEVKMADPGTVVIRDGITGIAFIRDARGTWKGTIHSCSGTRPVY
jgi:hypothetical protein